MHLDSLPLIFVALWLVAMGGVSMANRPEWMPAAPALPIAGHEVRVSTPAELREAIENARDGDTILVADGAYQLDRFLQLTGRSNVTIRGASGDAAKVELRGIGWEDNERDDILRIQGCSHVTIAYLTFAECHAYGVKLEHVPWEGRQLEDIHIYACNFRNIGTRAIKGTGGGAGFVDRGSIRFCNFENTKIPPKTWYMEGDYITAIDCMRLRDWVIADNYFHDLRGANGGARGAIFVWVESQRVTSERNVFVNCDRSIAYGNPSGSTEAPAKPHMTEGLIRNNFIVAGPDTGIELSWVSGVKVYQNTVLMPSEDGKGIHYHWMEITGVEIANNLVRGRIFGDEGGVSAHDNLTVGLADAWFRNLASGDLHLTAQARAGEVQRLPGCPDDFDGRARPALTAPGAAERE